jgi:type VI secretion system protein ImpC
LLEQVVAATKQTEPDRAQELVKTLVEQALKGTVTFDRNLTRTFEHAIATCDRMLSAQLNEIMHHPDFQRLEATWRGLFYLMSNTETSTSLKIKVFNVNKKDLLKDLQKASEFDQSALFKKVYEEEFGVFGGAPFGALIGDYEFGKGGQDMELLEKIAQVAAAAHAPFVAGTSPEMFNLESFTELDQPRDLAKIFDTTEYAKWKSFRQSEDSRYVALTVPRVLIRQPYGMATVPVEAFNYEERVDGMDHSKYLWANAAWALGARITQSFALYGWTGCYRAVAFLRPHFQLDELTMSLRLVAELPAPAK